MLREALFNKYRCDFLTKNYNIPTTKQAIEVMYADLVEKIAAKSLRI